MTKRKKPKFPTQKDIDKYRKEVGDFDEGASLSHTKYRRRMGDIDKK